MTTQDCDVCTRTQDIDNIKTCSVCAASMCGLCKGMHDIFVKRHAALCHIAIDNTSMGFAGVLCRQCGKEARCDHSF